MIKDTEPKITIKQMCEHIVMADILEKADGTKPTAEQIYTVSPTGELWQVFEWYKMACEKLGYHANQSQN